MKYIPAIESHIVSHSRFKKKSKIFNLDHDIAFKQELYVALDSYDCDIPLRNNDFEKLYEYDGHVHLGCGLETSRNTEIFPVTDSVLEYAGFAAVNGNYVMLSHPEIQTEDGYILTTMYMHCSKYHVQFSSREKMLRQISLNSYPLKKISKDTCIGVVGNTGNAEKHEKPYLHIQCELRNPKTDKRVIINPSFLFD